MQEYGKIENGNLITSDLPLDGYKPVIYAELPQFDQLTQAVIQSVPVDNGDVINVGVQVVNVDVTNNNEQPI